MEIIKVPEEHVLIELSSTEILALWKAFARATDAMEKHTILQTFEMTPDHASNLRRKLADALDIARRNTNE